MKSWEEIKEKMQESPPFKAKIEYTALALVLLATLLGILWGFRDYLPYLLTTDDLTQKAAEMLKKK